MPLSDSKLEFHVAAVPSGLHREMHPYRSAAPLEKQFIKVHLLPVRRVITRLCHLSQTKVL